MRKLLIFGAVFMLAFSPVVASAQATTSDEPVLSPVDEDGTTEVQTPGAETSDVKPEELEVHVGGTDNVESDVSTDDAGDSTVINIVDENGDVGELNLENEVTVDAEDVPYLALGADLTADQKQKVLDLMGIGDADLSEYDIVTVTNEEEHQYLDSYIDPAKIGTHALSSVLIMQGEPGSGISISTKNINYCTAGMYRNALATAGLSDAEVIVAGPFEISGTAALIGAMKAYSEMTGETIDFSALDIAVDELVLTGSVRDKYDGLSGGEAEELIAYLKGRVLSEDLTDEQMKKLIKEGAETYGVELDDEEVDNIVSFLNKLKEIDIDEDEIMGYAEKLYDKFKDVKLDEETQNFFLKIINAIIEFFRKLFGEN